MTTRQVPFDVYQGASGYLEAHRHDSEFLTPHERGLLLEIRNAYVARYNVPEDLIQQARAACRDACNRAGTPTHLPSGTRLA